MCLLYAYYMPYIDLGGAHNIAPGETLDKPQPQAWTFSSPTTLSKLQPCYEAKTA